jgi:hypothetical protein
MSFIEIVRKHCREKYKKSPIKLPYEENFSIAHWASTFRACNDGSIQDRRLYEAGRWFYKRFEILKRKTSALYSKELPKNVTRLQVGLINWDCKQAELSFNNYMESNKDRGISIADMSDSSAYIEGLINASRYSIAKALREQCNSASCPANTVNIFDDWLDINKEISILYNGISSLFQECLWNDWYIISTTEENNDIDIIQPSNLNTIENYHINLLRWKSISEAGLIYEWVCHTPIQKKERILRSIPSRIYGDVYNEDGRIKLKVGNFKVDNLNDIPFEIFAQADLRKNSFFTEKFYTEALPGTENLNLQQILHGWGLIVGLAEDIYSKLVDKSRSHNTLLEYSSYFSQSELENLMESILCISSKQASKIIDLLTFKNEDHDLWDRPLVKIDDDSIVIILKALIANPIRLASRLLNELGFKKMGDKGKFFEEFARNSLAQKNKLNNAQIYLRNYPFNDGKVGDIDLVLAIGNVVLLCETKCSTFPSEANQIYNYYESLKKGSLQANRSAKYVSNNLSSFLNEVSFINLSPASVKILPVVISNYPLATGLSFNDMPVIDLRILEQFIGDGKYEKFSCATSESLFPITEIQFYYSESEAENGIEEYLRNPPQVITHKQDVSWFKNSIEYFEGDFNRAYEARIKVDIPAYSSLMEQ